MRDVNIDNRLTPPREQPVCAAKSSGCRVRVGDRKGPSSKMEAPGPVVPPKCAVVTRQVA